MQFFIARKKIISRS